MNVAIDTSLLKRDRKLESSDILFLSKLSKLGLIKLHIPWVIYKEATSQNIIEIGTIIDRIVKDLTTLDRKGIRIDEQIEFLKLSKKIELINIADSVMNHWNEFIISSKAILHILNEKHGEIVMASYFSGSQPFPSPKSRKDIPDAFIYQALISISKDYGNVEFICDDNNLRECCNKVRGINGHKSFSDLYDIPDFKIVSEKYKKIEHYSDELIVLEENIDEIKNQAKHDLFNILNNEVILSFNIPADDNEGKLVDIIEIKMVEIDKTKIQFIDDNFYIPVYSECILILEYFIFKSEYFVYEGSRRIHIIDSKWNDHYYLVQESFDVKFSFKYKVLKDRVNFFELKVVSLHFDEVNIIREN